MQGPAQAKRVTSEYLLRPRGFGMVRLKVLLALTRSPEMDEEGWHGRFVAEVGPRREVKARAFPPDPDRDLQEVRLEDSQQ